MTVKPTASGIDRCDECGFEYRHPAVELPDDLRGVAARFAALLAAGAGGDVDPALRRRPAPEVWSALAYACHVRDLMFTQRERLFQLLIEDDPAFSPMYREERVALGGYEDDDPGVVAAELSMGTELLARTFARLDAGQWQRTCRYNYPVPAERSVLWLAQHTMHEAEHHLQDAHRVLAAVTA